LIWYENPKWKIHDINTDLQSPHCLQIGDIDKDGDLDAATCAYLSRKAAWFENDGKGNFMVPTEPGLGVELDEKAVTRYAAGDTVTVSADS
jgi:L-alanine-DL-glutamate epimerase-like enolase superfamily enzyme